MIEMKRSAEMDLEICEKASDLILIRESREALSYWIKRAVEAEKRLKDFAYVNSDESLEERCQMAFEEQEYLKKLGYSFDNEEFLGGGNE